MAFDAQRHEPLFFPEFTGHHLAVDFADESVALHAGGDDVVLVYRRLRVRVGQDIVARVTAREHGGDDQPLFEQPFTMDALFVSLKDLVLGDIVGSLDLRVFRMALGTWPVC